MDTLDEAGPSGAPVVIVIGLLLHAHSNIPQRHYLRSRNGLISNRFATFSISDRIATSSHHRMQSSGLMTAEHGKGGLGAPAAAVAAAGCSCCCCGATWTPPPSILLRVAARRSRAGWSGIEPVSKKRR